MTQQLFPLFDREHETYFFTEDEGALKALIPHVSSHYGVDTGEFKMIPSVIIQALKVGEFPWLATWNGQGIHLQPCVDFTHPVNKVFRKDKDSFPQVFLLDRTDLEAIMTASHLFLEWRIDNDPTT